ncbi:type IV secretion system protein [Kingella negevensis]|uniref:TrbL/VirB6 plasmid conjugal transfer protein n=1 Tax=Kingella negevensis TaxID=1522312 RepID=A0A238TDA7_9NEIS|nr:type IV secretion system protein [Kingella negevensis]WII94061.1 type IV secretion system protein [Kingella negevensis]SNB79229.1 TrbL/VirB6 plasmid conjugal transfer protein [Kingella negevensis]
MFENIFESLLKGMGSDLFAKTANIITEISPLFASGFGIYIVIVALNAYNRGFDDNFVDLAKRAMGWLIIIACAFNASQYLKIANMLYELPEYMSGLINSGAYNATTLDNNLDKLQENMGNLWALKKEIPPLDIPAHLGFTFIWVFIFILVALFLTAIAAFYLVAKISLAMVILIGPIFIGAMLFPATRQWGMNWIGQVMSYAVTVTFYVLLGAIQLTFFEAHMLSMTDMKVFNAANGGVASLVVFVPIMFMYILATIIFFVVALSIPSIAAALTGGATIGGYSGVLRSASSVAKQLSIPNIFNRMNQIKHE